MEERSRLVLPVSEPPFGVSASRYQDHTTPRQRPRPESRAGGDAAQLAMVRAEVLASRDAPLSGYAKDAFDAASCGD